MKCPKCSLVTFDHLSKCPKCGQTFRLQRRLTRVGPDPDRRIVLPGNASAEPAAAPRPAPAPVARDADRAPASEPESAHPAPVPSITASDLAEPAPDEPQHAAASTEPAPPAEPEAPRRSIFAADLAPAEPARIEETAELTAAEAEPPDHPAHVNPHAADAGRLKRRMIANSQQRRKQGHDLVSETVDPILPDWYAPSSLEEEDEAAVSAPPVKR